VKILPPAVFIHYLIQNYP